MCQLLPSVNTSANKKKNLTWISVAVGNKLWIQIQQARHLSQIYMPALEHNVPKNRTWIHSFSLT